MARHPSPWYWEARDGWYATVGGVRHRLADGRGSKRDALRRLGELLAERDRPAEAAGAPAVGHLIALYLADLRKRRAAGDLGEYTRDDAKRRLAGFADLHGDLPADQLRPHHVQAWLDTRAGWGPTSRHDGVGAVKAVTRWAAGQGHLDRDPLAGLRKPPRRARREAIPDPEAVRKVFAAILTSELADLLAFVHETGCRPKEARTLEARHLDLAAGVATLAEHKTARKTGRRRSIYLTPRALGIARRLAEAHPVGPIFRNSEGRTWTHNAVGLAVRRLRERAGLGKEVVAYALRHGFATDALANGVPVALVAELMGHADLRMMGTYSHLSDRADVLREAAARARGGGQEASS